MFLLLFPFAVICFENLSYLSLNQGIGGIPPIAEGYNPATWMLEVTTTAVEQRIGQDFADIYLRSNQFRLPHGGSPPPFPFLFRSFSLWNLPISVCHIVTLFTLSFVLLHLER